MKKIYKMAVISFALAFAACDDSTAASENGDDDSNVACTDEPVDCPSIFVENAVHDSRDCHWYKVAEFGTQTWMIENLSYNSCHLKGQTWCYDGNGANCEQYGRLYTWTAVMGLEKTYQKNYANATAPTSGICPSGYHVPSDAEWQMLFDFIDGNGGDATAFNFQYSGEKSFAGYSDLGRKAFFWTASEDTNPEPIGGPGNAIIWTYTDTFGFGGGSVMKDSGLSVRCVKD
jgi:uncharacterized protein (TIGR02145 family)